MKLSQLKVFLWQCTKLNFLFLLLLSLGLLFSEQLFLLHAYFYGGTLIEFKKDLYLILGVYKLLWIFFNLIPCWVIHSMDKAT